MKKELPFAVSIMGPTGTGKTDLAVELASRFPFGIISVDSALVYRGMDIGTAKPEPEILERTPHRLIDIINPDQVYSAASFRKDALREMEAMTRSGKIPLLVGGTGLYFRALLEGLSELPSANPEVRKRLEQEAEEIGWKAMHARLANIDPESAERIHPNDPQRIERALEIYEITGRPPTSFFQQENKVTLPWHMIKIILEPEDRSWLHKRLQRRFDQMLKTGLVAEVEGLKQQYELTAAMPSMRLVGYRQVWQYLAGKIDHETMRDRAVIATRQLAKRQLTWFRSMTEVDRILIDKSSPFNEILQILNKGELFLS